MIRTHGCYATAVKVATIDTVDGRQTGWIGAVRCDKRNRKGNCSYFVALAPEAVACG